MDLTVNDTIQKYSFEVLIIIIGEIQSSVFPGPTG
jgi:hypothetical protein